VDKPRLWTGRVGDLAFFVLIALFFCPFSTDIRERFMEFNLVCDRSPVFNIFMLQMLPRPQYYSNLNFERLSRFNINLSL
jgi:hypothetical protein